MVENVSVTSTPLQPSEVEKEQVEKNQENKTVFCVFGYWVFVFAGTSNRVGKK